MFTKKSLLGEHRHLTVAAFDADVLEAPAGADDREQLVAVEAPPRGREPDMRKSRFTEEGGRVRPAAGGAPVAELCRRSWATGPQKTKRGYGMSP
ncbi:hypothetical protein [Anaeromyxobacter terrae]|uniref:hypothetical protein n=1 Tax=Anaeromyxobacter terrae TaxID=2925406 RepID=UPI001F582B8A|nr:hypothetical protein [Anaeromyxobacter sp. SG22]